MKLYGVDDKNTFTEYQRRRFKDDHVEETIEAWLEKNPECIVEKGGLLIIGRQVTTNLNTSIDLLGVDPEGNVAVIELKRDKTPRETLAQTLEYASFVATLTGNQLDEIFKRYTDDDNAALADSQRRFFSLAEDETVTFNKNQRLIIVGTEIVQTIRQSATYLRQKGLLVTCLEFVYFETKDGGQLLSMNTVVGQDPANVTVIGTATLPKVTEAKFLAACDEAGRTVFEPLLAMAKIEKLPIHWGSRGFSLNLNFKGNHIGLCFGYPKPAKSNQSPQSMWSGFSEIAKKVEGSAELIEEYSQKLLNTGLFVAAGHEVKYLIKEPPTPEHVKAVVEVMRALARAVSALASSERS